MLSILVLVVVSEVLWSLLFVGVGDDDNVALAFHDVLIFFFLIFDEVL